MQFTGSALVGLAICLAHSLALAEDRYITLDNKPIGSREKPLVLRTYFPDPGLGRETLSHHDLGQRARNYTPGKGDVEGFVDPIPGIPGAIGVSFGPELSICWDTTECRLLYAWQGGFMDMTNYWGTPESGRRGGFNYLPSLVGELIYLTKGSHPLAIFDTYSEDLAPTYLGYKLVQGVPEFSYRLGEAVVHERIEPGKEPMTIVKHYTIENAKGWGYFESGYKFKEENKTSNSFQVTIAGKITTPGGAEKAEPTFTTDKPNAEWGEALYTSLGCFACHSLDGTRGHGPTFTGLYGATRSITGAGQVEATEAYISESILNPMAKVVETFPAGYMPPYPVNAMQVESLVLFIKSHASE